MDNKYWFPAKTYGYGWGFPTCWQGWVVLISYTALIMIAPYIFTPTEVAYYIFVGVLTAALIIICYKKGEPTSWRWGK